MQEVAHQLGTKGGENPAASGGKIIYSTDDGSATVLNGDAFVEAGWLLALPDALLLEIAGK